MKYYSNCANLFEEKENEFFEILNDLNIRCVDNGVFLPLRLTNLSSRKTYEGGVTDENYNFISGYFRKKNSYKKNKTCVRAYVPDLEPEYRDEEAIYAGILFSHFGHQLTDGFSFLWALLEIDLSDKKVVFLNEHGNTNDWSVMMELLGLDKKNIIILNEDSRPLKFKKIYVPDQSFYFFESFHKKFILPYEKIKNQCLKLYGKTDSKKNIYLSRTRISEPDCVNEDYFENFYRSRGYEIIHLQEFSFPKQVEIIASAENIASTVGTLTHMAIFANNESNIFGLLRVMDGIPAAQFAIDKLKKYNITYVDVSCNFFPAHQDFRSYYIGANENWRRFVLDKYSFYLSFDIFDYIDRNGKNFGLYLRKWISVAATNRNFNFINKVDIYDFLISFQNAEHSMQGNDIAGINNLNDLYGLGKKISGKKFNLYIQKEKSEFVLHKKIEFVKNGLVRTISGKAHSNESKWKVIKNKLNIFSDKNACTHDYFESKVIDGKICFVGFYKKNPFILFKLEELGDE